MQKKPIVTEKEFACIPELLWNVITDPSHMRKWFFENIPAFEAKEGFETEFNVHSGGRDFPHQWRITDVQPLKKIVYNWKYRGYPGNSFVYFELAPTNSGTRLVVTHEGSESFPADIPEFKRESCEGGWNYFIRERLTDYIANLKK